VTVPTVGTIITVRPDAIVLVLLPGWCYIAVHEQYIEEIFPRGEWSA
jgi:hypothetical protein